MNVVSSAYHCDDVILWRALSDVDHGFYVDVGGQDPVDGSATKVFYDRGWRGINIESAHHWHARLSADRPGDVNLRLLICSRAVGQGESAVRGSVLNAGAERERSGELGANGLEYRTLDEVLAENPLPVIHFLRVSAEGGSIEVLAGLDLARHRPWILAVRMRASSSAIGSPPEWEPGLLAAGYCFACRVGLSRFYLAEEHSHRSGLLACLPGSSNAGAEESSNQGGEIHQQLMASRALAARLLEELDAARNRVAFLTERLEETRRLDERSDEEVATLRLELDLLENELASRARAYAAVLSSHSWRVTRPLRVLRRLIGHDRENVVSAFAVRLGEGRARRALLAALRPFPSLRQRVISRVGADSAPMEACAELLLSDRATEALRALDEAWAKKSDQRQEN